MNTNGSIRPRHSRTGTFAALAMAVGLAAGTSPAAASHSVAPNDDVTGHQAHVGHVGGGYTDPNTGNTNPCATYHSFDGTYVFEDGSLTIGTTTFSGNMVVQYQESANNSNSWHEFADGSYGATDGCKYAAPDPQNGVGPGNEWIPGFTMTITGYNPQGNDLTCTDNSAEYARGRDLAAGTPDARHQNFRSNGDDVSCTIGDFDGLGPSITPVPDIRTVDSTQVIFACSSPIAPPSCVTQGSHITFGP